MKFEIKNTDDRDLITAIDKAAGQVVLIDDIDRSLLAQSKGERDIFMIYDSDQNEAVGTAILNWRPRYAFYQKLNIPEIQDVKIITPQRRKGFASLLINHCENMARQKICEYVGISVALHNGFGPAQILYAKLGYMPDGNGITYDRAPIDRGRSYVVDDQLCLMMVKALT
jgi:GNAT superfamily N-acetyltransferase